AGIRVDEFGLGYPPRIWGKKIGETVYSLNWLPFGGFVKIHGEDLEEAARSGPGSERSFAAKPKWIQVAVLIAGILCNFVFAWLVISAGYMGGTPASVDAGYAVSNPKLTILDVVAGSPAAKAGLQAGDEIERVYTQADELRSSAPDDVSAYVASHQDSAISIEYERGGADATVTMTPAEGIVEGQKAIGISMDSIGTLRLPLFAALWEGLKTAWNMAVAIVAGLWMLISDAFRGHSDLSQVAGPVGIASMVGQARSLGFSYVLSFMSFISINLAIINLIPFPALDGGRILFVIIEAIKRKPISARVAGTLNMVGFTLLIGLMLVVTFNDILRLAR
ncbi:MAG TPA: RIP metalloprotease RseP, partial [Candidatus Paceibacterota bacterium]|nr:RIP metalloprotease RseP [Candidatus Paceibacterota bacterium]